jgi:hypothetical protein
VAGLAPVARRGVGWAAKTEDEEARMLTGLILVAFIAGLFTFGFTRVRRRMGMGTTGRTWGITFLVTAVVILGLWATGHA